MDNWWCNANGKTTEEAEEKREGPEKRLSINCMSIFCADCCVYIYLYWSEQRAYVSLSSHMGRKLPPKNDFFLLDWEMTEKEIHDP